MPPMGGFDVARGVRKMNLLNQPTLAAVSGNGIPEMPPLNDKLGGANRYSYAPRIRLRRCPDQRHEIARLRWPGTLA